MILRIYLSFPLWPVNGISLVACHVGELEGLRVWKKWFLSGSVINCAAQLPLSELFLSHLILVLFTFRLWLSVWMECLPVSYGLFNVM